MRLSLEADYAIRITRILATAEGLVKAKVIAEQGEIPERFTLKILRKLCLAGITCSSKGVTGGYLLARPANEITILEVMETIDGPLEIFRCDSGGHPNEHSPLKKRCNISPVLRQFNDDIRQRLNALTFDQFIFYEEVDCLDLHMAVQDK